MTVAAMRSGVLGSGCSGLRMPSVVLSLVRRADLCTRTGTDRMDRMVATA
jgi:hypothetical protein